MRRAAPFVVLIALASTPVAAQDARLAGRLEPPVLTRVTHLMDSVRSQGLPTEPLVDKALEGASKRAPGDRIVAAVRLLASDLGIARSALGRGTPEPELIAGAAALRAGAAPGDLSRLRSQRRGSLTVPLAVLANLMARGVPSDTASSVVIRLASRGAPDEEFTDLQAEVERDIGTGASPAASASVRSRGGGGGGGSPNSGGTASPADPGRGNAGGNAGGNANPGRGNQGGNANPGRGNQGGGNANPGRGRGNPGGQANPGRGNRPEAGPPGQGGRERGNPNSGPKPKNPNRPPKPK